MSDFMSGATLTTILPPRRWEIIQVYSSVTPETVLPFSPGVLPFTKAIFMAAPDNTADIRVGNDIYFQPIVIPAGTSWEISDPLAYSNLAQFYLISSDAGQLLNVHYHPL